LHLWHCVYVSRWSSADKAAEICEIYARSLKQRYQEKRNESWRVRYRSGCRARDSRSWRFGKAGDAWTTEEAAVVIWKEQRATRYSWSEGPGCDHDGNLEREVFGAVDCPKMKGGLGSCFVLSS